MNQIYCLHLSYSILESSIVLLYVIAAQQYTILIWQRFNLLIAMLLLRRHSFRRSEFHLLLLYYSKCNHRSFGSLAAAA